MVPVFLCLLASGSGLLTTVHMVVTDMVNNDIFKVTEAAPPTSNLKFVPHSDLAAALAAASIGDGLMVFADAMRPSVKGVPQSNTTTEITPTQMARADALGLNV